MTLCSGCSVDTAGNHCWNCPLRPLVSTTIYSVTLPSGQIITNVEIEVPAMWPKE